MKKMRCAVYTRKSSEEGLEQEFNSLDAQYESCVNYINSQKHEGWVLYNKRYDDGGLSGGTLNRAALQDLLCDVKASKIDHIIVYKIDRLTRSLYDFAKLIEILDKHEVSFVSVTQSFNTSTSMGRLTLNMLLSFAQFEREVTSERIGDKIAASKKKGMWMGGTIPLGYNTIDKKLVINTNEANIIQDIYKNYLTLKSLSLLRDYTHHMGYKTKSKIIKDGRVVGDKLFTISSLHHILTNPLYHGKIKHRDNIYDGLHAAIIDDDLWDKAQKQLQDKASYDRGKITNSKRALLQSKLYDAYHRPLTPSHTVKKGKRYDYYISHDMLKHKTTDRRCNKKQLSSQPSSISPLSQWRLSAKPLEDTISNIIKEWLHRLTADTILDKSNHQLLSFVQSVTLQQDNIHIIINSSILSAYLSYPEDQINTDILTIDHAMTIQRRGVETRLIIHDHRNQANHLNNNDDKVLLHNIAKAHYYYDHMKQGISLQTLSEETNTSIRRIQNLLRLAFISPKIITMIEQGQQPISLTTKWLLNNTFPYDWNEQYQLIKQMA